MNCLYNEQDKHIHFAVTPINYENGCRFRNWYEDYYELSKYLAEKYGNRIQFELKNSDIGHFHCFSKSDEELFQFWVRTGKIMGRDDIR